MKANFEKVKTGYRGIALYNLYGDTMKATFKNVKTSVASAIFAAGLPLRAGAGLLLVAGLLGFAAPFPASGAPADYRFEATQPRIKMEDNARVVVRLVHVPTGKLIPDAIIFQTHLEMAMQGAAPMRAKASQPKATGGGLYALQAPLNMEGQWTLHLSAKVQGEKDTVAGAVTFTTIP
jgi:hypothetical protein